MSAFKRATLFDSPSAQNQTERRAINFLFRQSFRFLFPRYVFARIRRAGKTIVGQRVAQCEFSRANTISTVARPTAKEDRSYRGIAADVYRELKGSKGDGDVFRRMAANLRQLEHFALHLCVFSRPLSIRFSNDRTESVCMRARICSTSGRDVYKPPKNSFIFIDFKCKFLKFHKLLFILVA